MAGSIEDICSLFYAQGSVDKMLCGKAYSRALYCHSLIRLALALIILQDIEFSDEEEELLDNFCLLTNATENNLKNANLIFLKKSSIKNWKN